MTELLCYHQAMWNIFMRQALMEERLTDHLQGHMDEIYHLKQNLAYAEEKMAYLSYERTKAIWEVLESFKSRTAKLETLQQATQVETMEYLGSCPQEFLFRFTSLLFSLAAILLAFVSTVCTCPLPLVSSRLRTCITLMLIGLGALAWQKWHTIPTVDWQAWVPSRWRLCSRDSGSPSEGP
ncbi:testis-specific protein TEX28 [Carlito syrichta]|uniref:Testis-specific protein TEX28 n=1 Tax=Carlito syrichta TaxID=1868482 RepID=A0A1U7UBT7_CARSF|nr:testis-specific protein TEX28 [Carlito syrichta]